MKLLEMENEVVGGEVGIDWHGLKMV